MDRFPFSAVVGQDLLKTALLVNIINPSIGGVLICGPKGSGKSTIVHSIESVLPLYTSVAGCRFRCDPSTPSRFCSECQSREELVPIEQPMRIISLPLSCTEDRLIGSVDVEVLLKSGRKLVQPGILGEANQNVLYIDEVNLLPDHLVDDILDVAASHWNSIEREGVSIRHPSSFVLIGTMNPEEGDLRPQILDRFPLCVQMSTIDDPAMRTEIMRRNLRFEADPDAFGRLYEPEQRRYRDIIGASRQILLDVRISDACLDAIARAAIELKVDGQRPDIAIVRTSRTLAALNGRIEVRGHDIETAAGLVMAHRTRDGGLLEPPSPDEVRSVLRKHITTAVHDDPTAGSGSDMTRSSETRSAIMGITENSSEKKTSFTA